LQLPEHVEHPAAARGMAAVAESLGVVVELVRSLEGRPGPPAQQPFCRDDGVAERAPVRAPAAAAPVAETSAPARAAVAPPAVNAVKAPSSEVITASVAPRAPVPARPPEPKVVVAGAAGSILRKEVLRDSELRTIDAPLGANSPTNFYTGLAGGEVITAGGLFVATYQMPKLGETVLLEISLPGGYEFLAKAIVAWTRSAVDTSSGSMRAAAGPPGFGARFAEITEEGRRLIQRYVKNRQPLFHDD
jgi:Tfp pilus assembly protein PilZ